MWRFVPSLRALFVINATATVLALFVAICLALWGFSTIRYQHERAAQSYEQLALATDLKAGIGAFLIAELDRIMDPKKPDTTADEAQKINQTIAQLTQRIDEEIIFLDDEKEKAKERAEYQTVRSIELLFARVQRLIREEHMRTPSPENAMRTFIGDDILADYQHIDRLTDKVVAEERLEVGEVIDTIRSLSRHLLLFCVLIIVLTTLLAFGAATATYRALVSPLAKLSAGSAALAEGNLKHHISIANPPELADLGQRFNDMARRISAQQTLLTTANRELEKTIAERTRQLAEKADQLSKIDHSRRLFFAKVGHELRTPLTVLLGEADVALRQKDENPARYREALTHIAANGEFLKRRISDLTGLARSEDGKITLENQPFCLESIFEEIVETANAFARSSDVTLTMTMSEGTFPIHGDQTWLRQAVLALIDNAVKFSPKNSIVDIRLNRHETSAIIEIADQGSGVPSTDLPNLFNPYYQSTQGRRRGGSGLGLAVARWVTEHHQGRIIAENIDPKGFCVRMEFPLAS